MKGDNVLLGVVCAVCATIFAILSALTVVHWIRVGEVGDAAVLCITLSVMVWLSIASAYFLVVDYVNKQVMPKVTILHEINRRTR